MNAVYGITSALREKRIDHFPVIVFSRQRLERFPEDLGLHWPVTSERGVTPAEQQKISPRGSGSGGQVPGDFFMLAPAFRSGQAAGIGQDEEHLFRRPESLQHGAGIPGSIYIHTVDRLYSGRVVIQNDDFPLHAAERGGKRHAGISGMRRIPGKNVEGQYGFHGSQLLCVSSVFQIEEKINCQKLDGRMGLC